MSGLSSELVDRLDAQSVESGLLQARPKASEHDRVADEGRRASPYVTNTFIHLAVHRRGMDSEKRTKARVRGTLADAERVQPGSPMREGR